MSVHPVVPSAVIPPPASLEPRHGQAKVRFDELVSLGKQAVDAGRLWARIGRLVVQMERDQDYAILGYETMGACIMEVELLSGYDRSSIYAYKTLYEETSPNAGESILQMPLGSAQIYRQLPAALQRDPDVQQAAKAKPKVFREKVAQDYPQALIETRVRLTLNLDNSLYEKWRLFLEKCRADYGQEFSYEQVLEVLLANVEC